MMKKHKKNYSIISHNNYKGWKRQLQQYTSWSSPEEECQKGKTNDNNLKTAFAFKQWL